MLSQALQGRACSGATTFVSFSHSMSACQKTRLPACSMSGTLTARRSAVSACWDIKGHQNIMALECEGCSHMHEDLHHQPNSSKAADRGGCGRSCSAMYSQAFLLPTEGQQVTTFSRPPDSACLSRKLSIGSSPSQLPAKTFCAYTSFAMQGTIRDGHLSGSSLRTSAHQGRIDGIPVVLLRPDWGACNIFRGSRIYGGSCSELEAYLFLCRCVCERKQRLLCKRMFCCDSLPRSRCGRCNTELGQKV